MIYIDGFVAAVPAANKDVYLKHATAALPLFKEFGASGMVECWADDVPEGKVTDFRRAVKAEPGEEIIFSWITYPSREVRDEANKKLMEDARMQDFSDMPFDGRRMIYGGFAPIFESGSKGQAGYVDGCLIAVPTAKRDEYKAYAEAGTPVFLEHGATRTVDAWGDDVPHGKLTDFYGAVSATEDETVVFCWVEWPSKAVRDEAWGKIMADPRMQDVKAPFDLSRMVYGGFTPILDG